MAAEVVIPYAPRPQQQEIHDSTARFDVAVCHRRFGKTVMAVNKLIRRAAQNDLERPRYAYIAPLYRQAKQVAWDYLKHYTRPIPECSINESELRVDLPGDRRIQLFGADNPDALRGIYLDGVVMDEVAQMPPRLWGEVIRPALSDRKGWALFIGTPRGRDEFCELYESAEDSPGWERFMYRASETGIIDPVELAAARNDMDDAEFAQEYECSFTAAITGSYYGKLMEQAEEDGRISSVPAESMASVGTAWDLGIGDDTAIWFWQEVGREIRLIDFYQNSGVGIDHYARVLKEKDYLYGEHLLPHDAEPKQLGTGKSIRESLSAMGIKSRIVPMLGVDDGINAARAIIPRCWFDKRKCGRGIESLKLYRREWVEKNRAFRARPLHDWTSHAADAFRYLAVGLRENRRVPEKRTRVRRERVAGGWMGA